MTAPLPDAPALMTFRQQPAGAGTLFLFVPGLGGNVVQWRAVERALAQFDVALAFLPAIRPHPALESLRPLVEDIAARTAHEITAAGYDRVVVLAHSVGSFVGFELAHRIPDRVAGVVAVNGALYSVGRFLNRPLAELAARPSFGLAAVRLSVVAAIPTTARVREFVLRRERLASLVAGKLVPREMMRSETSRRVLMEGTNQRGIMLGLWANRRHWPRFAARAGAVTCPVVLITGTLDPLTSEQDSQLMAAMFPSATVEVLEGIGHAAPLQAPEPIIAVARRLAGLQTASTGGAT